MEERGAVLIEVVVHYPSTAEGRAELNRLVVKLHAQYILQYVEKLNCPLDQKKELIEAVAQTVREQCRKT